MHKEGWYWMYLVFCFFFGIWVGTQINHAEEKDCEDLKIEMLAFTQCLRHQPPCQMEKGVESFIRYYKIHDIIKNECRNRGDDDQSQSIESNNNGKE